MICTNIDSHIKNLIRSLEMLWVVTLNDGTVVYSDFDRLDLPNPYIRLKEYCEQNKVFPVKIEAMMLGAPRTTMFEDPNGLDGVFILRGSAKDMQIETGEGISYKQLIVGLLRDDCQIIDVKKFCWPENALEPFNQNRLLTPDNAKLMIFKHDSRKKNEKSVQVALFGGKM